MNLDKETRRRGDKELQLENGHAVHLLVSLSPGLLVFSLPLLRLNQRPAGVMAAVGADDVRGLLRAALRAGLELLGLQGVVGAAHAGAGVRLSAFGYGHGRNLSEMLSSKGFGEFISLCGQGKERQGRDKAIADLTDLSRRLAIHRGVKDNLRFRRFASAHSDDSI